MLLAVAKKNRKKTKEGERERERVGEKKEKR